MSGIFALDAAGVEQRLFHTADFRVRQVALSQDGSAMAASIFHRGFTSNIAVLDIEGGGFTELTEGDSLDMSPRWTPGPGRRIVFQSAGVGRDGAGHFRDLSPFAVQEVDLDSGALRTLVEEEGHDLLNPQIDRDGALYYVRRPRETPRAAASPLHALKDAVLFPFRLGVAVFQYVDFFSMRYTQASRSRPVAAALPGTAIRSR